jgi:hypothetical protein
MEPNEGLVSIAEETKNELIELTLDACRRLQFNDSRVLELVGLDAAAASARLIDEVYALRHRMDADPPGAAEYQDYFEPSLLILDMSILALTDWAEECRAATAEGRSLCWRDKPETRWGPLESVLVNLANGLVAIRMLVLRGLWVQARTLARTNGELADLAIAMLHDESIYDAFRKPHEDFDSVYEVWRSHLAPGHLRKANEKLYTELGFEDEWTSHLVSQSKHDQQWLSLAAHNYYVVLAIGAMAFDVTQPLHEDAELQLGTVLQTGSATLRNVVGQTTHFLRLFSFVLLKRHQWRGDRKNSRQTWAFFRNDVIRDLSLRALTDDDDDDDPDDDDSEDQASDA